MIEGGYMGVFVEEEQEETKSCSSCLYEKEIDRAGCNACSRAWGNSGYTKFIGWKSK